MPNLPLLGKLPRRAGASDCHNHCHNRWHAPGADTNKQRPRAAVLCAQQTRGQICLPLRLRRTGVRLSLFYRYALGQIAGLVHILTEVIGCFIAEKLQGGQGHKASQRSGQLGDNPSILGS